MKKTSGFLSTFLLTLNFISRTCAMEPGTELNSIPDAIPKNATLNIKNSTKANIIYVIRRFLVNCDQKLILDNMYGLIKPNNTASFINDENLALLALNGTIYICKHLLPQVIEIRKEERAAYLPPHITCNIDHEGNYSIQEHKKALQIYKH